jgi:hypothetical protein
LPDQDIGGTVPMMTADQTWVRRFRVAAEGRPRGGISVAIPFDPSLAWGDRDQYHVHGTVGGHHVRGPLVGLNGGWSLQLGPSWCRTPGFGPGDEVEVILGPEGPQSTTLGTDVAAAFASEPAAARFFDSLPSFYRKNYARWIEGAKRPETRAKRIAETVDLARLGKRER